MTDQLLRLVREKSESIIDLKYKFELLVQRIEDAKKEGLNLSFPEFEAFGWERFDEFIIRLEEALNVPLLEEARNILENSEIDERILEKLKSGLSVRREGLVKILGETTKEFAKIQELNVKARVKGEISDYLENGKWDELITRIQEWQVFEENAMLIIEKLQGKRQFYWTLFERALEEGPSIQLFENLQEIETKANQIGGDSLLKLLMVEQGGKQINPLSYVDDRLQKIAEKKEDIRHIIGENIDLTNVTVDAKSLECVIKKLDDEYKKVERIFKKKLRDAERLRRRHNNLALILKKPLRSTLPETDLKQLKNVFEELSEQIKLFEDELHACFTQDARELIDTLCEGSLPTWEANRVLKTLKEIVSLGYSFEIKSVEQ